MLSAEDGLSNEERVPLVAGTHAPLNGQCALWRAIYGTVYNESATTDATEWLTRRTAAARAHLSEQGLIMRP